MDKVLYIDGYNLFYRMLNKHTAKDANSEPIGGFVGSVNALQKWVNKFMPSEIYYIFDGIDAGRRRRSLYSGYKDKRGRKSRSVSVKLNDELTEQVNNEQHQIALLFDCLKQLPIKLIAIDSYEADDVIAHLVRQNQDKINIICSTDRDYLQLINENTFVWSTQAEVLYTPDILQEKYNIIPENFLYMRSIIGDPSDKLKGVKGIGEETLFEILPALRTDPYKDFWEFWKAIEETEGKGKNIQKLKEGKDDAKLMYDLMNLKDDTMSLRAIEALQQQLTLQEKKTFSKLSFKIYCLKNNIGSILKNYESWIRPFVTINALYE